MLTGIIIGKFFETWCPQVFKRTDELTDGQVEHVMPLPASQAWLGLAKALIQELAGQCVALTFNFAYFHKQLRLSTALN